MFSCSKENSERIATLVRKPAERDAAEQRPTPIRKGYWRNKWRVYVSALDLDGGKILPPDDHVMSRRYPSKELAEQYGLKCASVASKNKKFPSQYLGPVFFPADGEKQ